MYENKGNIVQKNLQSINGYTVHYIEQDLIHKNGFYIIKSRDYDSKLDIIHSHNRNYKLRFDLIVEPATLTIFDFIVDDQENDEENDGVYISLLRDDEFISAEILYKEEQCDKIEEPDDHGMGHNYTSYQKDVTVNEFTEK